MRSYECAKNRVRILYTSDERNVAHSRLSLGGGFERQVSGAVLDLEEDEAQDSRKKGGALKW